MYRQQQLSVSSRTHLTTLVHSTATFSNLKQLSVNNCHGLKYLFTSSTARKLVHLEELCIVQCVSMEEILAKELNETASEAIRFERLSTLILDSLSSLSCFYSGNGTLHLSSLIRLLIWKCPSMKIFSNGNINAESFVGIQVSLDPEEGLFFHQDLNTTVKQMFERGKFLGAVDEECFSDNHQLQSYRYGKVGLQNEWLCDLVTLKLHNCTLSYGIPSSILPHLKKLKELEVFDSNKVEVIFYMNDTDILEAPSQLQILVLKELSELTHIWKNNSQELLRFPNLKEIVVSGCEKLRTLLPASLAKTLEKLEKLEIESCYELQEIVVKEVGTANVVENFVFPSLKKLDLCDLPRLTYLYPHTFTLECLTLNKLSVLDCHELELFQSARHIGGSEGTTTSNNTQPLISNLEAISNLKKLRLDWKHISALCLRFRSEIFAEGLKCLEKITLFFDADENEKAMLPIEMLQMAPNLIEMSINCWNDSDIFLAQHPEISEKRMLGQLKILTVSKVSELYLIQSAYSSWLNIICEKLQKLNVSECPLLTTLVHPTSAVSFYALKEVFISKCLDLQYLFTFSAAKWLRKLEKITVKECKSLKVIVAKQEGNTSHILEFDLLHTIALESLPSLICFYPENKTLHLPSLINVHIKECCNMEAWSQRASYAKSFPRIKMSVYPHQDLLLPQDLKPTAKGVFQPQTHMVSLTDLETEHVIWRGVLPIPNFYFSELDTLIVDGCPFLSDAVLPFHLLSLLPKLETLEVRNCDYVKTIFDVNPSTQDTLITFPMKNLVLLELPELETVWNEDPHDILCLQHLKKVEVKVCESLRSVFPASVAKDLELEDLVIEWCERLVEIVAEDNTDPNIQLTLPCPYLISLKLRRLQKFTYFYYCSHKSDIYTYLESATEHQLPNEKLFKCLSLGENGMKMILRGEFERKFLENLKALSLYFSSDVFGCKILEEVPNIEKLVVCDGSFKEMFSCESPNNVLQHLKVLRLEFLGELVSIGLENSCTNSFVRNLETFEVIGCGSLKNLVACTVSFSNMTCLKVQHCNSLSYLLTSSTAKSLGQLKRMEIKDCASIEEIVSKEDEEESDEDNIIFPQLTCLNLDWLPNLKRFYRGSLGFPSLEELSVIYCDKMITLCVGSIEACKLSQVKLHPSEAIQLETDLNSTMRQKYLREIAYMGRSLELRDRADLQEIWGFSLQDRYPFAYLKTLIVNKCKISSDVVLPLTLLSLLPELETLEILNCDYAKTIFDVNCTTKDISVTFPLKKLVLRKLPNLETVYSEVKETNPAHPETTNPKLKFPYMTSLTLSDLPNFKHDTIYCIHDDAAAPTFELIIPNLEDLTVGKNELKMIVDGEFQKNLLHKLKVICLCFDIECDEFPEYGFLQQLPNVKKLVVWSCSFKVIFCHQRPNNTELLLQLKELRLEFLKELVSIGLENFWTEPFVRNLETFEVIGCSSLENLVTYTVSFSNLTCLKVKNCDGLSYLFTSSTAKSLGRLQRMEIQECKSIEVIVSKEREESREDEIIFSQLSYLKLDRLLNLLWFYRGSLSFPSLKDLSVWYCNEMVTLCPSTLKANKLCLVRINYHNSLLDTDLYSTMQKEFGRKISELEYLNLKSGPRLQEIWHGSLHVPDLCFSKLTTLIVDDCQFLSDAVLPFHLLPLLPELETLQVRNCDYVKTIFDVKCTTKDTLITLPLGKLTLSNLSNLKNVWNRDPHGILRIQHLRQVHVTKCKDLTSVFPASVAKDLWKLKDLIVEDCEGLIAIVADESGEDEEIIFERLQILELKRLQGLRCFYAGNFTLSFPFLKEVHVIECGSMRTFSAVNKINHFIWYYSEEDARPRKENDLSCGVRRTSEEEVAVIKGRLKAERVDEDARLPMLLRDCVLKKNCVVLPS